jgi:hypothetical protein
MRTPPGGALTAEPPRCSRRLEHERRRERPGANHRSDDLLIASIASDLAWTARKLLRASGLPDDVSVSAKWRTTEGVPSLADIRLTVTVSSRAEGVSAALAGAFANSLAARPLAERVVHISFEGVNP